MTTMNTNINIDYEYAYFRFDWNWIKDKQIILKGNKKGGALIIADAEGNVVRMYGYERIM